MEDTDSFFFSSTFSLAHLRGENRREKSFCSLKERGENKRDKEKRTEERGGLNIDSSQKKF